MVKGCLGEEGDGIQRGIEERRREVAIYASEPCLVSSSSERAARWMRLLGGVVERWKRV